MAAQPERLFVDVERLLTRARHLRDALTATTAAPAWERWVKRCGLSVAIPVLATTAWLLSRSKIQVATTVGTFAILGAITAAIALLPHPEPFDDDSAPQPGQPTRTIQLPPTSTVPPPTITPDTAPSPPTIEPPAGEPDTALPTASPRAAEPAPAPPPTTRQVEPTDTLVEEPPDNGDDQPDDDQPDDQPDPPDQDGLCLRLDLQPLAEIGVCLGDLVNDAT